MLESPLPFLAPWTALLTVHATVHRSFSHGVQTTLASAIGVAVSFLIGNYLGVNMLTFALALFIGVAAARLRWIREEGIAIATTAIFVLGSGFTDQEPLLDERLLEVCVGVATGIAANLLIAPPLRDRQAARQVDRINQRMGALLIERADEFSTSWNTDQAESWIDEGISHLRLLARTLRWSPSTTGCSSSPRILPMTDDCPAPSGRSMAR